MCLFKDIYWGKEAKYTLRIARDNFLFREKRSGDDGKISME